MENVRTLIDVAALKKRIDEMGAEITRDFRGQELVMVTVLKGSFMFAADLSRAIDLPIAVDFLGLRSYGGGTETTGVVQITSDLSHPVEGKHVLVVEDIVDTGLTMAYLLDNLKTRHPASVKLVSLLHKPARTRVQVDIDYLGFTIDDVFVIGYGLDYAQRYRNLPYIGVLEKT